MWARACREMITSARAFERWEKNNRTRLTFGLNRRFLKKIVMSFEKKKSCAERSGVVFGLHIEGGEKKTMHGDTPIMV